MNIQQATGILPYIYPEYKYTQCTFKLKWNVLYLVMPTLSPQHTIRNTNPSPTTILTSDCVLTICVSGSGGEVFVRRLGMVTEFDGGSPDLLYSLTFVVPARGAM